MLIFMAHLLLFQPVISFWGWQYFGSGDKESLYINYLFFLCWGIWYFSTVWFLIEGKSACQCRRCGFDPWGRKILLYGRIMLPKWACHSPTPPPLTVFSAHQVCVSGVHSFFLVICLQLKSICRSALFFGKQVYNLLLSLSFLLWRPDWFPRWLSGKGSACHCRRCRFNASVGKIPCRRKWPPTPVFLPEEFHGQEPGGLQSVGSQRVNMTENACRHGGPVTLIPLNIYASAVRQQIFDPSHFLKAAKHVSSMVFSEGPLAVMVF